MPEENKDLKDKVIEEVAEAAEDLVEELVEDITDGKDNSANPWYKRWWNNWTKSVSVLAIIGGLGTFGLNFSTEWYKDRKDAEYERINAVERQLEELNKNIAVQNESLKAINDAQKDEKMSRQAMWRALRQSDELNNEVRVQVKINAILNERNYNDIKSAHARENSGQCQMHDEKHPTKEKTTDVKKLNEFQKILKKTMGSDEEKAAIKKHEDKEAQEKKMKELLDAAKKDSTKKEDIEDYKNRIIQQQQQQQQQEEQR